MKVPKTQQIKREGVLQHHRQGEQYSLSVFNNQGNGNSQVVYKVTNTDRNMQWSMCKFEAWKKTRTDAKMEACPDNLLCSPDPAALCEWLSLFAAETRNAQGKPYTPSFYQLLSGLLRYMQTANPEALNFLDKRDK